MLIYVKILTGQTIERNGMRALVVRLIHLEAEDDDTVLTIKAKLQERLDVTPNHQRLLHRGTLLENDCTLKGSIVQAGSELWMEIKYPIQICVQTWDNQNLIMDVFASDRVKVVKVLLEQTTGVLTHQQMLTLASAVLQDDFTLQDYNVRNGAILIQMRNSEPLAIGVGQHSQCGHHQPMQPQHSSQQAEKGTLQLVLPPGLRKCRVCGFPTYLQHGWCCNRSCCCKGNAQSFQQQHLMHQQQQQDTLQLVLPPTGIRTCQTCFQCTYWRKGWCCNVSCSRKQVGSLRLAPHGYS